MKRGLLLAAALWAMGASAALALPPVVMDGSAGDIFYGAPIVYQDTETNFGNASLGRPDICNGSELDAAYGFVWVDSTPGHFGQWLYLVIAGNLETNGNDLEIFLDTIPGQGQNRLLATNPGSPNDRLLRMSEVVGDPNAPGLTFASGFAPDYWVSVDLYGDPAGVYVNYAKLYVDENDLGAIYYVGAGQTRCETNGGELTGGDIGAPAILCTADNSNVDGVAGGMAPDLSGNAALVTTGIEIAIPLIDMEVTASDIAVVAFVNGQQHDWVSNQVLGGLFGSDNLGEPRQVNFATTSHLPFTISATPIDPIGACCVGGTCTITTESACNGNWLGAGVSCAGNPCGTVPSGRCCVDDGYAGKCYVMTQAECQAQTGYVSWAQGETCEGCPCIQPPHGACCQGETCSIMREAECTAAGGLFVGDNTNCNSTPCELGACCLDTTCSDVPRFQCSDPLARFFPGVACSAGPCSEPTITNPHVAGAMQGWNPTSDPMDDTDSDGVWTRLYTGLAASTRFEFKITNGLDWSDPGHRNLPSANSWAWSDADGNLLISYDANFRVDGWAPNRDRLPLPAYSDPGTWVAAGDFQSAAGGSNWDNASTVTAMVSQGDGKYLFEKAGIPAGNYAWKAVKSGTWDSISWDGRSVNTANMSFTVSDPGETLQLWVDAWNGAVKVVLVPAPLGCPGDYDCDNDRDFDDIKFLVAALGGEATWVQYHVSHLGVAPTCDYLTSCDSDGNGAVDFDDIKPFVRLIGVECP